MWMMCLVPVVSTTRQAPSHDLENPETEVTDSTGSERMLEACSEKEFIVKSVTVDDLGFRK